MLCMLASRSMHAHESWQFSKTAQCSCIRKPKSRTGVSTRRRAFACDIEAELPGLLIVLLGAMNPVYSTCHNAIQLFDRSIYTYNINMCIYIYICVCVCVTAVPLQSTPSSKSQRAQGVKVAKVPSLPGSPSLATSSVHQ